MFRINYVSLKDGGTLAQIGPEYGPGAILWEQRFDTFDDATAGAEAAIAGAWRRLFDDPTADAKMAAPAAPIQ